MLQVGCLCNSISCLGYYFVADDSIFNVWYNLTLDTIVTSFYIHDHPGYWNAAKIRGAVDLVENKYKNDTRLQNSWKRYLELVSA